MTQLSDTPETSAPLVELLARTICGESPAATVREREGLAAALVNSWQASAQQPRPPLEEHLKQCSCWQGSARERKALQEIERDDPALACCLRIARRAVAGRLADPTGGATAWHPAGKHPDWASPLLPSAEIGNTLFYRLTENRAVT